MRLSLTRLNEERGGAMVEMSISMLVIVPVTLYALFLDDLLRFRLDQQEAVASTLWDYTTRDYQNGSNHVAAVQSHARLMYCDHTGAYDSFDRDFECDNEEHHEAVAGHVCWIQSGSAPNYGQVTCSLNKDTAADFGFDMAASKFHDKFTQGGKFTCTGQVSVLNYLIPQGFLQRLSGRELFEKDKFGEGESVHDARGAVFTLNQSKFSVLADPWVLNDSPDIEHDKGGPLYERVNTVFRNNPWYLMYAAQGTTFFATGMADNLISPLYLQIPFCGENSTSCQKSFLGFGDNPFYPYVSMVGGDDRRPPQRINIKQEGRRGRYWATPWYDWNRNSYERVWNKRGKYYMGARTSGG